MNKEYDNKVKKCIKQLIFSTSYNSIIWAIKKNYNRDIYTTNILDYKIVIISIIRYR